MESLDTLKDRLPDLDVTPEETTGAALFGLGLVLGGLRVARDDRGWWGWIMPGALILTGLSMLIESAWGRRTARIEDAEDRVREELQGLDPFARAQVIKDVASEQLEPIAELIGSED